MVLLSTLAFVTLNFIPSSDYVLVETTKYSFEIPKGWNFGEETPWGARDITSSPTDGKMGAMTAGPTKATWSELYKTSLGFILREAQGEATPFRTGKTKLGFECMTFEVTNKEKFADRRYTILKNSNGQALALSVKIPSRNVERKYAAMFKRMVDTAKIK